MKKKLPFHPLLIGSFPVLSIYLSNLDFFRLPDVWRPLLVVLAIVGVIWLLASKLYKDASRGALAVSAFLVVLFGIGFFVESYERLNGQHHWLFSLLTGVLVGIVVYDKIKRREKLVLTVAVVVIVTAGVVEAGLRFGPSLSDGAVGKMAWIMAALLCGVLAGRVKSHLPQFTSLANFVAIVLVAQPIIVAAIGSIGQSDRQVHDAVSSTDVAVSDLPDIYYIVLDGYGRADVLSALYGIKNDTLSAGLEERGFYVASQSESNYTQTMQSFGSSLNMDYLHELIDVDPSETDRRTILGIADWHRVGRELQNAGYEYTSIVTRKALLPTESADVTVEERSGHSLLEEALIKKTPFTRLLNPYGGSHAKQVLGVFENLDSLSDIDKPRLVIVHVVSPHPPFVFSSNGSIISHDSALGDGSLFMDAGGTVESYRSRYAEQARFIASRTLESIDKILDSDGPMPIIIVQSDHGPKSGLDNKSFENTDFNEVLPIINAYYVPDEIRDDLYPSISPVNSFRVVLRHLFNRETVLLSDDSYYSTWERPYAYAPIERQTPDSKRETPTAPE